MPISPQEPGQSQEPGYREQVPRIGQPIQAPDRPRPFTGGQAVGIRADERHALRPEREEAFQLDATNQWVQGPMALYGFNDDERVWMLTAVEVAEGAAAGTHDLGGFLTEVPEDIAPRVKIGLTEYGKFMTQAEENPAGMMAPSIENITELAQMSKDYPEHFLEALDYTSSVFGSDWMQQTWQGVTKSVGLANTARTLGAGAAVAANEDDGILYGRADLSVLLGLREGFDAEMRDAGYKIVKSGMEPMLVPTGRELPPDVAELYIGVVGQVQTHMKRQASELGISLDELGEIPLSQKDARRTLDVLIKEMEKLQPKVLESEGTKLDLQFLAATQASAASFITVLSEYARANPEEDIVVADAMADVMKIMSGESPREGEQSGVGTFLMFALDRLMRPDEAVGELASGGLKDIRVVEVVFDDGFVTIDPLSAMRHSLELLNQGYAPEAAPESLMISEKTRAVEMFGGVGDSLENLVSPDSWTDFTPIGAVGNAIDVIANVVQTVAYGAGMTWDNARFYSRSDNEYKGNESGKRYGFPVAIYDTLGEVEPWRNRWADAGSAIWNGDGQFFSEVVAANALDGAATKTWQRTWTTWILATVSEFYISPYNAAHSGLVAGKRAERAGRLIGATAAETAPGMTGEAIGVLTGVQEVMEALPPLPKKGVTKRLYPQGPKVRANIVGPREMNRQQRFTNGAEMTAPWVGAFDRLVDVFNGGRVLDNGAAEGLASLILTVTRDNPGRSGAEVMQIIKNDDGLFRAIADYVPDAALEGYTQEAFLRGLRPSDVKTRWVQAVIEGAEAEVANLVDTAGTLMGPKWLDETASRAKMMEQARGIFLGPVGFPMNKAARLFEKFNADVANVANSEAPMGFGFEGAKAHMDKSMARIYNGVREKVTNGTLRLTSGISSNAYATGLPSKGSKSVFGEVIHVPYRMKKMYAEQYRRRVAQVEEWARNSVTYTFKYTGEDGKVRMLSDPNDRFLVTLLAEAHPEPTKGFQVLMDNKELLEEAGVVMPKNTVGMIKKAEELNPFIARMRENFDAFSEGMAELGIVRTEDLVDNYVTRFYHGADAKKVNEYLAGQHRAATEAAKAAGEPAPKFRAGDNAKRRHGPVSIFEAIREGFVPELDAAALLYYRAVQYGEVEAKAVFAKRMAAQFGSPVITNRETVGKMLYNAQSSAWDASKKVVDNAVEAYTYNKSLGEIRKAIHDSNLLGRQRGFYRLAETLGLRLHHLRDPEGLVGSMLESEDFLRLAGSRKKSVLDKIFPASLREVLHTEAREILSLRRRVQGLQQSLLEGGLDASLVGKLKEKDMGLVADLLHQHGQAVMSLKGYRERVRGAKRALSHTKKEAGKVRKDFQKSEAKIRSNEKNGIHSDFDYRARTEWRGRLEAAEDRVKATEAIVEKHQLALKEETRRAAGKSREAGSVKTRVSRNEGRLSKRAEQHLESASLLREAEARAAAMVDGPVFREAARGIQRELGNLLEAKRLVRERVAAHALQHGIEESTLRWRVVRPQTPRGAAKRSAREQTLAPNKNSRRVPSFIGEGEARAYLEADEMFKDFGWTQRDTSAFLWEVFGAHHITEVPVHELRAAMGSNGGMMAKVGRFLFDPGTYDGRAIVRKLNGEQGRKNVREIARILGMKGATSGEVGALGERVYQRLDELFSAVANGDKAAQKAVDKLPTKLLSKLYVAGDVGDAFTAVLGGAAKGADGAKLTSKDVAARMVGNADSPLSRHLGNTFIPLEIGLVHRAMIGEDVGKAYLKANGMKSFVMVNRVLSSLAGALSWGEPFNRTFKTAATVGRGSFVFGHRNAWFDGASAMISLGLYGATNKYTRRMFNEDMGRVTGVIERNGVPGRVEVFRDARKRMNAMMTQRLDRVERFHGGGADLGTQGSAARIRWNKELGEMPRMESPGALEVVLPKQANVGIAAGAAVGAAAGDALLGGALGYTLGTVAHSWQNNLLHTGGRRARKMDFAMPVGAAANEAMENWYRDFALWSFYKAGMPIGEAMDRTMAMMRDYTNMTPFGQNIMRRLPVLFYNFTVQNAIATWTRMANSPARATFVPRLMAALSGDEGNAEDFQNLGNSFLHKGRAYFMSTEFAAGFEFLEPVWQAIHGEGKGAIDAVGQTTAPLLKDVWEMAAMDNWGYNIPQSVARRMYEKFGPIHVAGIEIAPNKSGAVSGRVNAAGNLIIQLLGLDITANDVGRTQNWIDRGDTVAAVVEGFFGPRIFEQDSKAEHWADALEGKQKDLADKLEGFQWDDSIEKLVSPMFETSADKEFYRYLIDLTNGKIVGESIAEYRKMIRAYEGKGRGGLPSRLSGEDKAEIKR